LISSWHAVEKASEKVAPPPLPTGQGRLY